MGIFDVFLKKNTETSTQEESKTDWNDLNSIEQIYKIKQESENQMVLIFKHSIRCGISSRVLKLFNRALPKQANIKMYYLDLIAYRQVSNEVSRIFQVTHQSPQLLIIKNKEVVKYASHYSILEVDLQLFVK